MLIDYAAITHQGRVRKNNEDAFLVSAMDGEEPLVNQLRRTPKVCQMGLLAAVADGMGGAAAGEIASREGLASIAVYMFGHWGRFPATQATEKGLYRALTGVAECASSSVLRYSDEDRTVRGMGSTLTAVVIWNGHAHFVQVGDSRAYLFRGPDLVQLTTDQTLVNEMIASGYLTPEQARTHPQRSMITQALGSPQPIRAELGKVSIRRGDRLLLCSDGLHGELSDGRIQEIMSQNHSPRHTLEVMLEAGLEHGGRDNITALLLALDDPGFPLAVGHEAIHVVSIPPVRDRSGAKIGLLSRWRRIFEGKSWSLLQGTLSLRRFLVLGPVPAEHDLLEGLRQDQFRPFEDGDGGGAPRLVRLAQPAHHASRGSMGHPGPLRHLQPAHRHPPGPPGAPEGLRGTFVCRSS